MKGRGETLSQTEIEALLASLPSEDDEVVEGEAHLPQSPISLPGDKQIRTWDFRKPDKFSKDHMRSLLALHQSFSRIAATSLSARLRTGVTLKVTSVDQGLYEEYLDLLPQQSVVNVVSMKPLNGNLLFELQPELAMVMLDRLLGGNGGPVESGHELTDIETALVRNLVRGLLDSMKEAWANLAEVEPYIEEIASGPHLVQIASPTDIVVIVLLEVQVGNRLGTMSLCIPHLVLEPLMNRLTAQVWVASSRRRAESPETRAQILSHLRRATVRVSAVLGEAAVRVEDLLHMQPGDVLLLGRDAVSRTRLCIVDQYRFAGTPGIVGGRLAVQINEIEEDDHADL
jgi:flagellar motor switch protein FliM